MRTAETYFGRIPRPVRMCRASPAYFPKIPCLWPMAVVLLLLCALSTAAAGEEAFTLAAADTRLETVKRLLDDGEFALAAENANAILNSPAAQVSAWESNPSPETIDWLRRRELASYYLARAQLGLARAKDDFLAAADAFRQLSHNRYRLPDGAHTGESAYWGGVALRNAGDYESAVQEFQRVGGVDIPIEMAGDAARQISDCLRHIAEALPEDGGPAVAKQRTRLLDQALDELDRARVAFPVGPKRKLLELDLIALRLARSDPESVRIAMAEAEAFLASDPAREPPRAMAALYRAQGAYRLGIIDAAISGFDSVLNEERPDPETKRSAEMGLGLSLWEQARSADSKKRKTLLEQSAGHLSAALEEPGDDPRTSTRMVLAEILLELDRPSAAADVLAPIMHLPGISARTHYLMGLAAWRRGRLEEAKQEFFLAARPGDASRRFAIDAAAQGARASLKLGDYGTALAFAHLAARGQRGDRDFRQLLETELDMAAIRVALGRSEAPPSLMDEIFSGLDDNASPKTASEWRNQAARVAVRRLGKLFSPNNVTETALDAYDFVFSWDALTQWEEPGPANLELAIRILEHLRSRNPGSALLNRIDRVEADARFARALAWSREVLSSPLPDQSAIQRIVDEFAASGNLIAKSRLDPRSPDSVFGKSLSALEAGRFLMEVIARWKFGQGAIDVSQWREEARRLLESIIKPLNTIGAAPFIDQRIRFQAIWALGRTLEYLEEYVPAADEYAKLMGLPEVPGRLRLESARHWALCMGELGQTEKGLEKLAPFAESGAEASLLAGKLAEASGDKAKAWTYYRRAADPDFPAMTGTPLERAGEAAYNAARLALGDPDKARPGIDPGQTQQEALALLDATAKRNPTGEWTTRLLELSGNHWLGKPDGWKQVYSMAASVADNSTNPTPMRRAMRVLAGRALRLGGVYDEALAQLDEARELKGDDANYRSDLARSMLETARTYRDQKKTDDAIRGYAETFSTYADNVDAADSARLEMAALLVGDAKQGSPDSLARARSLLSSVRDQTLAQKVLAGEPVPEQ